jgi:signal transduction histidine kinase
MVNAASTAMDFHQALETLARLQSAAPAQTAAKLRQIAALLQSLSEENSYLNARLLDEMPAFGNISPPVPPDELPETADLVSSDIQDIPEWFTGISDTLRPPLIAIRGRVELVEAGLLGQVTTEQGQWLQSIQENTSRAFAVLDAIQELIALQKGEMRIEKVNFISTDLLKEAWERIRDKSRAFNHEVTLQSPEAVPLAYGDFYQSLIILTDLLDNALHYTPPSGQIRMVVDDLGTHVLFSVADNGIGLTPADMESIGRPFWRGNDRMVRAHNGSGLRLYLAKQVLALLDGELIFSGEPGLGSTFSFTLPTPQ